VRRIGNLLEQIAERENLRIAVGKALKGKRDRAEARRFMARLQWHLKGLTRGLRDFANFYLGWFDRFAKETLRVPGYVRYMDDMLLWGESSAFLNDVLDRGRTFLGEELGLQLKPVPYINRTSHGVDFLGCRVLPDHLLLNRRSRVRFRRKLEKLESAYLAGEIDDLELQQRGTSLAAFAQAGGVKSWHFRRAVIEQMPVSGRRPRTG